MAKAGLDPTAIVICSTQGTALPVMAASIAAYLPRDVEIYLAGGDPGLFTRHKVISLANNATNFGDAYNQATGSAFADGHQALTIANDDIVLTPDTWTDLLHDLQAINIQGNIPLHQMGLVGARSDFVVWAQNIRNPGSPAKRDGIRWQHEYKVVEAQFVAPILAWVGKDAWQTAQFPPINWYSDNVIAWDLTEAGFRHFVSRAYIHHAGSQTIGRDYQKAAREDGPWVAANRPLLAKSLQLT